MRTGLTMSLRKLISILLPAAAFAAIGCSSSSDEAAQDEPSEDALETNRAADACNGADLTTDELRSAMGSGGKLDLGKFKLIVRTRRCAGLDCGEWERPTSIDFSALGGSMRDARIDKFTFPNNQGIVRMGDDTMGDFTARIELQPGGPGHEPPSPRPVLLIETEKEGRWPHYINSFEGGPPHGKVSLSCSNQTTPFYFTGERDRPCVTTTYYKNEYRHDMTRPLFLEDLHRGFLGKITKTCFRYSLGASVMENGGRTDTEVVFAGKVNLRQR
jgi:hypothetical protein